MKIAAWVRGAMGVAVAAGLGVAALSGATLVTACGEECEGGVIIDGRCEAKCSPDLCLAGNTCVDNRCVLECVSHTQCLPDQTCSGAVEDDTGREILACSREQPKETHVGLLCAFGYECDGVYQCPDGSACNPKGGGATCAPEQCALVEPFRACPDGTACTGAEGDNCAPEACKPLVCRSAGEGDAEAYCTTQDCSTDLDCAPGMYCGVRRRAQKICGTDKGTEDPCLEPSQFTANGGTYQEGPVTLLQNICLKREICAPCVTNNDCSLAGDLSCVNVAGVQSCVKPCRVDGDCNDDSFCYSTALNAGCVNEPCDDGLCLPRSGSCRGSEFCQACLNDLDCSPPGSAGSKACIEAGAGQRGCFDQSFPDTCVTDADCPQSPSGKHGECLDEGEGLGPGDSVYRRCYLPFYPGPSKFQCWPD